MNTDTDGHGTLAYVGFNTKLTDRVVFDGWASASPAEEGVLHEFAAGIGRPTSIGKTLTVVPLVYGLRDNDEYAVLPSLVIIANVKKIHFFAAPKVVLPFNRDNDPKLVVNPLYAGFKVCKKLTIGASGTVVNLQLSRVGAFIRYGG
ncbi:MAG TPA: hypothetical protein VJB93_04105, partial [Patescibacteria group bacterium]|nr:hypothetical protein [Patescibacteria group bacterium]